MMNSVADKSENRDPESIAFCHWWIGGVRVESAFPQGVERKTHPIISGTSRRARYSGRQRGNRVSCIYT